MKCFASGNRRTLSNNTLREILPSRSRHKRRLGRLFDVFYRIQHPTELVATRERLHSDHNRLFMAADVTHFEAAAEGFSHHTGKKKIFRPVAEHLIDGVAEKESLASVTSGDEQNRILWFNIVCFLAIVVLRTLLRLFLSFIPLF